MTRILFVCLGNICRSPMAEFIFKDLAAKAGRGAEFEAASAGTSSEEYGNPVYPPARRKLAEHGIACAGKTARQLTRADYDRYDLLIGMESPWYTGDFDAAWNDIESGCRALLGQLTARR